MTDFFHRDTSREETKLGKTNFPIKPHSDSLSLIVFKAANTAWLLNIQRLVFWAIVNQNVLLSVNNPRKSCRFKSEKCLVERLPF